MTKQVISFLSLDGGREEVFGMFDVQKTQRISGLKIEISCDFAGDIMKSGSIYRIPNRSALSFFFSSFLFFIPSHN